MTSASESRREPAPRRADTRRTWLLALALAMPATLPYIAHFALVREGKPTGFVQLETPYYMANARELFDDGAPRLVYGNPYSPRYETRAVYFQPQTWLLGAARQLTGWPPGYVFVGFGLVAAVVCARVMIGLYRDSLDPPDGSRRPDGLGLLLFAWGGGVLGLTGYAFAAARKGGWPEFMDFHGFDPFGGWWFLNLGRNLVLPTEAYYHALFLGAITALGRGRHALGLALALLTSLSHPFTGIELALIVAVWAACERYYVASAAMPRWCVAGAWGVVALHLAYYLGFLNTVAEHRALAEQWKLPWTLDLSAMVPAYVPVGLLAAWRLRTLERARQALGTPARRLLLVWFAIAFALANHEVVMRPIQPLHFTRGYIWTPLFLLGLGPLLSLLAWRPARLGRPVGAMVTGAVTLVFLSDNALWLASYPVQAARGRWIADVRLDPEQERLLDWLDRQAPPRSIVACRDGHIGYLIGTFTPLRSWIGHPANTPHRERRQAELSAFYDQGRWLPYWSGQRLLVVIDVKHDDPARLHRLLVDQRGGAEVYRSERYRIVRIDPAAPVLTGRDGSSEGSRRVR